MTNLDREQLKSDCADALEGHLRDQRVDRLAWRRRSGSSGPRTASMAS